MLNAIKQQAMAGRIVYQNIERHSVYQSHYKLQPFEHLKLGTATSKIPFFFCLAMNWKDQFLTYLHISQGFVYNIYSTL